MTYRDHQGQTTIGNRGGLNAPGADRHPETPGYEGGDDCQGGPAGPRPDPVGETLIRRIKETCGGTPSPQVKTQPRRLDFSDLDLPECLLIKPIRLWLHGAENWTLVGMQYTAHFGPDRSRQALLALRGLIEILNAGGRRAMSFHKAWSRKATGDERALVALAAAVQARDGDRAQAMALRLVGMPWQQQLLDDMASLTDAFTAKGHRFVHLSPRGQARTAAANPSSERPHQQAPANRP